MKSIRDLGYLVDFSKPLKLPRYDVSRLPDPGGHIDCIIIVNDPKDGPRARCAISNGASWDYLPWAHEIQPAQVVDVVPMVRQAVRDTLPALLPPPPTQRAIAAPLVPVAVPSNDWADDRKALATAMLGMAEQINALQHRVHFLEHNALDKDGTTVAVQRGAA